MGAPQEHFDRVCKAVDGAFRASHMLLKFLKLVAKQEAEYARAVLGSSRDDKKLFQMCNGTAGSALLSLFSCTAAGATDRQTYAHALRDTVCATLADRLETLGAGVARLQNLQKLNLAENAFRAVPECVGSLALLTELRMHANKITTVPPFLANLRALKLLDLGKNCIARIEDLQVLRGLTQLKQLNLAGNPVAAHPDYVTTIISILPDLQVLDGVSRNLPKARRPRAPRAEAASEKPKEGTEDAAAAAEAPKKRPPPATESKGGKPFHPRDKKQGAPQKPRGKPGARPGPKKPRMQ